MSIHIRKVLAIGPQVPKPLIRCIEYCLQTTLSLRRAYNIAGVFQYDARSCSSFDARGSRSSDMLRIGIIMPQDTWSPAESWAWEQICAGEIADFRQHLGSTLDPRTPEGWDERRQLGPSFLREVFYVKALRDKIPHEGVRVQGALFREKLILSSGRLYGQLWLEHCRFEQAIDLSNQTIDGGLSLEASFTPRQSGTSVNLSGSRIEGNVFLSKSGVDEVDLTAANVKGQLRFDSATVSGKLTMNGLEVGQALLMRGSKEQPASFAEVDLTAANVKGQLNLIGATVNGKLTMDSVEVGQYLLMRGSKEQPASFAEVDLTAADVKGQLSLEGATVSGKLTMNGLEVGRDLFMQGSKEQPASFAEVDLTAANVKGQLNLIGATVNGKLTMDSVEVGQNLLMRGSKEQPASFAEVDLAAADVKGQLSLEGATVSGKLTMNGLEVGRDLLMRGSKEQPASFAEVDLTAANVKGRLSLEGAMVNGKLTMTGLKVGQNLLMRGSKEQPTTFAEVDLQRSDVHGAIVLSGARFGGDLLLDDAQAGTDLLMCSIEHGLDGQYLTASLKGVKVGRTLELKGTTAAKLVLSDANIGELRICSMRWKTESQLNLRNTRASVLHEDGGWPCHIELNGFSYARLGFSDVSDWRARYLRNWLDRDTTYTPQPYEQLAVVFRSAAEPEKAHEVMFASRERARRLAKVERTIDNLPGFGLWKVPGWRYFGLTILKWTIGYGLGYRYFWSLWWVLGFTLLGVIVLQIDTHQHIDTDQHIDIAGSVIYSFQKLLPPFAKLESSLKYTPGPFAAWYFYIHQLVGFVLAAFLTAGLAGLTQKQKS